MRRPEEKIAHHAGKVPVHVAQAAPALSAGIMYRERRPAQRDPLAGKHESRTQVHVFVIEEVALVESTECRENLAWKNHEHAGYPLGMRRRVLRGMFESGAAKKRFSQDRKRRRKGPRAVLDGARGASDQRRGYADHRVSQAVQQFGKRV